MKIVRTRLVGLLAVAIVVLAAIVGGKLVSDHRQARLDDALHLLTAGVERLNASDVAGAQRDFDKSVAQFRAAGRDPLFALHHAFAARLRSGSASTRELQELSVPNLRASESLLALALAEDSSLLAAATTHRLLCLRVANPHWAQWDMPRPIESVGALHVDAVTGKAHLIVGDDGRLLTAECRAPSSSLVTTASTTQNQAAVAWVDADEFRVWLAPAKPTGAQLDITAQPLPGSKGKPLAMRVSFPGEANSIFGDAAVVHAIGKVGDNVLLFYGDAHLADDSDLRDESVLVIAIDEPERQTNRLVFPAVADEAKKGNARWLSTHVRRLLPASAPGRVYALTEGPRGVAVLGADAKPMQVHHDSLFSTEYRDGRETYDLSVKSSGDVAAVEVSHRRTGAHLNYQLPWRFQHEPKLAAIARAGRQVVVASAAGDLLLIDLGAD
jgi:hypothetical protein